MGTVTSVPINRTPFPSRYQQLSRGKRIEDIHAYLREKHMSGQISGKCNTRPLKRLTSSEGCFGPTSMNGDRRGGLTRFEEPGCPEPTPFPFSSSPAAHEGLPLQ